MQQKSTKQLLLPYTLIALVLVAWFGNFLYALGSPLGGLKQYSPALVAGAMIAYVLIHGAARYGPALIQEFILVVFAISWTFETVSIVTGIPFGNYHYTDQMAPFLGHVPVFVLPAYGIMGYASWSLATLILGQGEVRLDAVGLRWVPVLAACLMVIWDLSMDPLRATVEGRWIWTDGGVHFGVPKLNYLGWFVVTWLMFRVFALRLQTARLPASLSAPFSVRTSVQSALIWWTVPTLYLAFAVEYLVNPLVGHGVLATLVLDGAVVSVQDVYVGVAWLCALTMVPLALLGMLCIWRPSLIRSRLGKGYLVAAISGRMKRSSRRNSLT